MNLLPEKQIDLPSQIVRMCSRNYRTVSARQTLSERFSAIRHNYRVYQQEVDDGDACWLYGDPYRVANWLPIFTPIEMAAWQDIRYFGVPLWPQLPVGKYFADFGNPIARVALECDGAAYHDPVKDASRDLEFLKMGWRVIRVSGSRCIKTMDSALEIRERGEDVPYCYEEDRDELTLDGVLKPLRAEFNELRKQSSRRTR